MNIDKRLKDKLLSMTWQGLRAWTDSGSYERGKDYLDNVGTPVVFADGSLVAEVHGSYDYYTKLSIGASGKLQGDCTCAVGYRCKHCVALALVAAKMLKNGESIADADMTSRRWQTAVDEFEYSVQADLEDDEDWEEDMDGDEDMDGKDALEAVERDCRKTDQVETYLDSLGEGALRSLVRELVENVPGNLTYVQHKLDVLSATTKDVIHWARQAISTATSGWYDKWDRKYGHNVVPDYSPVKEYFKMLQKAGEWQALMELGDKLKKQGFSQIEQSRDEGEISSQIAACMDIVVETVMAKGTQDPVEKLKWADSLHEKDDYAVLEGMESSWRTSLVASADEWQHVSDYLMERYERPRAVSPCNWEEPLFDAAIGLERAGRLDQAVEMLTEALPDHEKAYQQLAEMLLRNGRRDEAAAICRRGLLSRPKLLCSYELSEILRQMAAEGNDPKVVAALELDEFLSHPSEYTYDDLRKSCEAVGAWKRVHDFILRHYESGAKVADEKRWPLAKIQMTAQDDGPFPCAEVLTDLALYEKRAGDVAKWYGELTKNGRRPRSPFGWGIDRNADVAEAVSKIAPEISLGIWQRQITENCEWPDHSCYAKIGNALRKMRPVMERLGRVAEWQELLDGLRTEYRRRGSLVKILNEIDRERGGSGRIAETL